MIWIIGAAVIVANAFGRRFAGGLLAQWCGPIGGTHVGRLVQAAIAGASVAALALVTGWPAPASGGFIESVVAASAAPLIVAAAAVVAALLVFLGATAGFPTGMLPRRPVDALGLLAHGAMAVGPLALAAWAVGLPWWWLAGAAAARVPAYCLAPLWTPHAPALGMINLTRQRGPIDPPPWAEFLSGAALGGALVLTFGG